LIVDDHGVLRAGLRALLNAEPDLEVIGEAGSGREALRLVDELQPDLVLMDISMPDLDGIEATRRLGQTHPAVRVLLLTLHEDPALLREAIQAGAAGYVIKRAVESELLNAVHAARAGGLYIHPSMTRTLLEQKQPATTGGAGPGKLTPRETEVLCLIAQGHTNREIAGLLHLSIRTVESHRANLRAKLGLQSRVDLVRYAVEQGLLELE
jgi:DNA-binding NarL/FixJ family response regulator